MKLSAILAKLSGIINMLSYFQRRRKGKLYEQWVQRADLPPEAIPREKVDEDISPKKEPKLLKQPILYFILGASLVIFCMGFILLIAKAC